MDGQSPCIASLEFPPSFSAFATLAQTSECPPQSQGCFITHVIYNLRSAVLHLSALFSRPSFDTIVLLQACCDYLYLSQDLKQEDCLCLQDLVENGPLDRRIEGEEWIDVEGLVLQAQSEEEVRVRTSAPLNCISTSAVWG